MSSVTMGKVAGLDGAPTGEDREGSTEAHAVSGRTAGAREQRALPAWGAILVLRTRAGMNGARGPLSWAQG